MEVKTDQPNVFSNITFSNPTPQDFEEVLEFYKREFIPDEPVLRSLDLLGGDGFIDRFCHKLILDDIMTSSIEHPTSIIARDENKKIVGLRLGKICDSNFVPPYEPNLRWCVNIPFFPKRLISVGLVQLYLDTFGYGIREAFNQLDCKTKIYFGQAVCVGRSMRGKGLGQELIERSNTIARSEGCEYVYLLASGKFSQAIFKKLGFQVLKEFRYEDIKDSKGKPIIWDYREHIFTQLVCLKL